MNLVYQFIFSNIRRFEISFRSVQNLNLLTQTHKSNAIQSYLFLSVSIGLNLYIWKPTWLDQMIDFLWRSNQIFPLFVLCVFALISLFLFVCKNPYKSFKYFLSIAIETMVGKLDSYLLREGKLVRIEPALGYLGMIVFSSL